MKRMEKLDKIQRSARLQPAGAFKQQLGRQLLVVVAWRVAGEGRLPRRAFSHWRSAAVFRRRLRVQAPGSSVSFVLSSRGKLPEKVVLGVRSGIGAVESLELPSRARCWRGEAHPRRHGQPVGAVEGIAFSDLVFYRRPLHPLHSVSKLIPTVAFSQWAQGRNGISIVF
ncbi:glutathione reductase [Sesbania bispinosa]|nr:glutathione reductase [Sesbania bispinosa]